MAGATLQRKELVSFIARSTGLNEGEISLVLAELRDTVIHHNLQGRPVKLDGLGTYFPTMRLDGSIKVGHRVDSKISRELNVAGKLSGQILNKQNIGLTSTDLVEMWNQSNPNDPIE